MALARTTKKQQKENRDEKDTKIITVKTLKTRCIISIKKEKNNDAILTTMPQNAYNNYTNTNNNDKKNTNTITETATIKTTE